MFDRFQILTVFMQFTLEGISWDERLFVQGSTNNRILYFRTQTSDVYRSSDEGKSWSLISTNDLMDGISNTTSRIWRYAKGAPMPDGSNVIYFWSATNDRLAGYKQLLWVSSDGGESFELRTSLPRVFDSILPHPYFPGVALLMQNTGVSSRVQLWKTEDAGLTFKRIFYPIVHVQRISWAPTKAKPLRIVAGVTLGITTSTSPFWNYKVVVSDNFFADYRLLLEHVSDWRIQMVDNEPAVSTSAIDEPIELHPELGAELNQTFPQEWPAQSISSSMLVWSSSYRDASYNRIDHALAREPGEHWEQHPDEWKRLSFPYGGGVDPYANTWNLLTFGQKASYVLSWRSKDLFTIFKVDSRIGPNTFNDSTVVIGHYKDGSLSIFPHLPGTLITSHYVAENDTYTEGFITSRSGNGGSHFTKIAAPDSTTSDPRFLIFTGISNTSPLIYGPTDSIGSLFVTATVANSSTPLPLVYNRTHRPEVSTFFTGDGGYTWQELGENYQVPEFAARGALVAYASTSGLTQELTYSLDDGQTWRNLNFSSTPVRVQNIRVASDYNSRTLFVLAYSTRALEEVPVSSHIPEDAPIEPISPISANPIDGVPDTDARDDPQPNDEPTLPSPSFDFAPENSGEANYSVPYGGSSPQEPPEEITEPSNHIEPSTPPPKTIALSHLITVSFEQAFPLCNSSDYEIWTPLDESGAPRCLMGERTNFRRRKAGHFCFPQPSASDSNQAKYDWPIIYSKERCVCSLLDYECAPCFERAPSGKCQFVCGAESRSYLESRFPSFPYDQFVLMCTAPKNKSLGHVESRMLIWNESGAIANRKIAQSNCEDSHTDRKLDDAVITCRYPPSLSVAPNPSTTPRTPFITSDHLKLIILMSVSLTITLTCACGLIHSKNIMYRIVTFAERLQFGSDNDFIAADFDLDAEDDENAVEMQEVEAGGAVDPTTSSEEEIDVEDDEM